MPRKGFVGLTQWKEGSKDLEVADESDQRAASWNPGMSGMSSEKRVEMNSLWTGRKGVTGQEEGLSVVLYTHTHAYTHTYVCNLMEITEIE